MAFDAFLRIEGIDGECTDANHDRWIELLSVSHGLRQDATTTSAGGALTGGRVSHSDITLVKVMDSSSPTLYLACCNGASHPEATIEFCRAGKDKVTFYKLELTDVVITSIRPSAAGGGDFPEEEVSMTYGTIKWTYTKTDTTGRPLGEVVTGWNLEANTKL